jgi:hypothetical protein
MEEASSLFRELYNQHYSIEICIAELKRKGFNQLDTVKALVEVAAFNIVDADKVVCTSITWTS